MASACSLSIEVGDLHHRHLLRNLDGTAGGRGGEVGWREVDARGGEEGGKGNHCCEAMRSAELEDPLAPDELRVAHDDVAEGEGRGPDEELAAQPSLFWMFDDDNGVGNPLDLELPLVCWRGELWKEEKFLREREAVARP